jgi:DNA-binding response OmpR family regulator
MILVTEDERAVRSFIVRGLAHEGYSVREAPDGDTALELLASESFALILLDWVLPRRHGLEVLRDLRGRGDLTPVIMLTARDAVDHRIQALDAGADDYVVKPFSLGELLARVRAVQRRGVARADSVLRCADLELDRRTHRVARSGRDIALTATEFRLLACFLEHHGEVLSRSQLLSSVWGVEGDSMTNVVDVHVHHLRNKLDEGSSTTLLQTIRGVGYVLREP